MPVWDLPLGRGADAIEEPAADFGKRLAEALTESKPLSDAEHPCACGVNDPSSYLARRVVHLLKFDLTTRWGFRFSPEPPPLIVIFNGQ